MNCVEFISGGSGRYRSLFLAVIFALAGIGSGQLAFAQSGGALERVIIEPDSSTIRQTVTGAALIFGVAVRALDATGVLINPEGLTLGISRRRISSSMPDNSYPLSFAAGIARTTVTISLNRQGEDESDVILFVSNTAGASFGQTSIQLIAVEILSEIGLESPETVIQTVTGSPVTIAVTAMAIGGKGNLVNPQGAELVVSSIFNIAVVQSTYSLNFVNGIATANVMVQLLNQDSGGFVSIGANRMVSQPLIINVQPAPRLNSLSLTAPEVVKQSVSGQPIEFTVTLVAAGQQGEIFNPEGLSLMVIPLFRSVPVQLSYPLNFIDGMTVTTVTVALETEGEVGSVMLDVFSSVGRSSAFVRLEPVDTLGSLTLNAPLSVIQQVVNEGIEIAVEVTATGTLGAAFNPTGLILEVIPGINAIASTAALFFIQGSSRVTLNVNLVTQGLDGRVTLRVASGSVISTAIVNLQAVELLNSLVIETTARVQQQQYGQQLLIPVRVSALGTKGNLINPQQLMLSDTSGNNNALLSQNYTLNFSGGIAESTVAATLVDNRRDGLLVLSVVDMVTGVSATTNVLLTAFSELSTVTLGVDRNVYKLIGSRNDPIQIAVTAELEFIGAQRPVSLQLTADFSTPVLSSSFDNPVVLNFRRDGIYYSTATVMISIVLGIDHYTPELLGGTLPTAGLRFSVAGQSQQVGVLTAAAVAVVSPPINVLTFSSVPAQVVQSGLNQPLRFDVVIGTVLDVDNQVVNSNTGEAIIISAVDNVLLAQSTYTIRYDGSGLNSGNRQLTVPIELDLAAPEMDGEIQLSVVGSFTQSAVITRSVDNGIPPYNIRLIAAREQLAALSVSAPPEVSQSMPAAVLAFSVTVTATSTFGRPFDPQLLSLTVVAADNAVVMQSNYPLTFVDGVARTTVTAVLERPGFNGQLLLSVTRAGSSATAAVILQAVELFDSFAIETQEYVMQQVTGVRVFFDVEILARGTQGGFLNPPGVVELQVFAVENTTLNQNNRALDFVSGRATTTIAVDLLTQGIDGSVVFQVGSGADITSVTAFVRAVELLSVLTFQVPDSLFQRDTGDLLSLPVAVFAEGSKGTAVNPDGIYLEIVDAGNTTSAINRFVLNFTAGRADAVIDVGLLIQAQPGRVELQLSGLPAGAGYQPVQIDILPASIAGIQIEVSDNELIQIDTDQILQTTVTITVTAFSRRLFPLSGLELLYSAEPSAASVEFSPQQLIFSTPTSALTSSLSVTLRILPQQAQDTTLLLTVGNAPFMVDSVAVRIVAVPRRLATVNLIATASTFRETLIDEPVVVTGTVVSHDNYGQPFTLNTLALDITATANAIVTTPQFTVTGNGMLELKLQITLADRNDSRVTLRVLHEGVEIFPADGLSFVVQAAVEQLVLVRAVVELVSPAAALIQNDSRLPVQFVVRVRALNLIDRPVGFTSLGLSITASPDNAQIFFQPEILDADAAGVLVTVVVLPMQNTTLTLEVTGLPENIVSNQLLLRVQADSGVPTPVIDLTNDGVVSVTDILIAVTWLRAGRPEMLDDSIFFNLPVSTSQVTVQGIAKLQQLFSVETAGDNADVNSDGVADTMDMRLIFRYISGLRGLLVGDSAIVNRILLLLGMDIILPEGVRPEIPVILEPPQ